MMRPSGWDECESVQYGGEYEKPGAGGYIFGIVDAKEKTSKSGNPMLTLWLDIAEGKFKNYYRSLSEKLDKDCYLKYYQLTQGDNTPYFKGMVTAIENSNEGYQFDFQESSLVRKLVGGCLREEEYETNNGDVKMTMKIVYLCSIQTVRDGKVKILEPKLLRPADNVSADNMVANGREDLPF